MKRIVVAVVAGLLVGLGCANRSAARVESGAQAAHDVCTMHPEVPSSKPSSCSKSGMALVRQ